ncbi:hypothetical protein [Deinococcus sonorensis]|uniref:Uncharacterized protein n=2 Tax=Deinococcus sonorensis TaxID=309891 RepID=A0AAU7U4J1_9DEIO
MSFHILYAPHPPQFTLHLTLDQLARRDRRFAQIQVLHRRGTLGLALQDSADLQQAHYTLRTGQTEWHGTPGQFDEDSLAGRRHPAAGWSEAAVTAGLGLDLVATERHDLAACELGAMMSTWSCGVIYAFAHQGGISPTLTRRLNLANFYDQVELDGLALRQFEGYAVVCAHRLDEHGQLQVWRTEPQRTGAVSGEQALQRF